MKLNISSEIERFNEHLNETGNDRIIFSGIFGIGKTYFLEKFFNTKKNSYEMFFIDPVNYSISKNDDIINYLKYDISFELLKKGVEFEKTDFTIAQTLPYFLKKNVIEIINILAKNSGKIGKGLESLIEITKNIKNHNKDLEIDEKEVITNFLKDTTQKESSIFHENLITELLSNKIQSFNNEKKETVLVIDDLDRIDPEHIFRLLNVFANHVFDKNKFGFSKVILVCDITNIRNIFTAKYGQNVDFSGYIDKFFSHNIYMFDNKKIITESISDILKSIRLLTSIDSNPFNSNNLSGIILQNLLADFVKYDIINLRSLLKNENSEVSIPRYHFKKGHIAVESNHSNPMIVIFDILKLFFGSLSSLEIAIDKYDRKGKLIDTNQDNIEKYGILIMLVDIQNNKSEKGIFTYKNTEQNIVIEYDIINSGYVKYGTIKEIKDLTVRGDKDTFPISFFVRKAFDEYLYINNNKA